MKGFLLFHPESPGMRIPVVRNWWQRLLYPKDFATLSEVLFYYEFKKAGATPRFDILCQNALDEKI